MCTTIIFLTTKLSTICDKLDVTLFLVDDLVFRKVSKAAQNFSDWVCCCKIEVCSYISEISD